MDRDMESFKDDHSKKIEGMKTESAENQQTMQEKVRL